MIWSLIANSLALASLLLKLVQSPGLLADLENTMRQPATVDQICDRHARLYASLA